VVLILIGAALLERFSWTIYAFGAFLLFTGLKLLRHKSVEVHPERNPLLMLVRRIVPISNDYDGQRLFARSSAGRVATPLLAVLVTVAATDVLFATDSIPAIYGVTNEAFIVFAANAFALLGLRSLYFVLAGMMMRFAYLQTALAIVLAFIGAKMILSHVVHVPTWASLLVIVVVLGGAVLASWLRKEPPAPPTARPESAAPMEARQP
jgi:tellurite resistance protein TerC